MIRIIPYILCLTLSISCVTAGREGTAPQLSHSIVGSWAGMDGTGKQGNFTFSPEGYVSIVIGGEMVGSSGTQGIGVLRFSIDQNRDPATLDIIAYSPDGVELRRLLMIMRFLSPNRLKLRTNFNDIRPKKFAGENIDDTLILDRVQ